MTQFAVPTMARLDPRMRVERYKAPQDVAVMGGVTPLIDPKDPADRQVQLRRIAHCKIFNLLDPIDLAEYERVWQMICDTKYECAQHEVRASPDGTIWKAYLRWTEKFHQVRGA